MTTQRHDVSNGADEPMPDTANATRLPWEQPSYERQPLSEALAGVATGPVDGTTSYTS